MSTINFDLTKIKAFIFDIDGVLSAECVSLSSDGEPLRMINVKYGYAITVARRNGSGLAIITGGHGEGMAMHFSRIGVEHIYMKSSMKIHDFNDFIQKTGYKPEEVAYVGDDIPDYHVMKQVGLPVARADAAPESKKIAKYIAHKKGGQGVARDVIEQVMKAQGKWMNDNDAFVW